MIQKKTRIRSGKRKRNKSKLCTMEHMKMVVDSRGIYNDLSRKLM